MRRLSSFLIVLTATFTANWCQAQNVHYALAGDVPSPQSWEYPEGQRVYLRDLLEDGGYDSAGTAIILRGVPLKVVSSDSVDPATTAPTSVLSPGDVVVFRAYGGQRSGERNALVMLSDVPDLLEIPDEGYSVSRLLELTQLPPDTAVSVTRTGDGSAPRISVSPHDLILHGDIVHVGGIVQAAGVRISQLYQAAPSYDANISSEPLRTLNTSDSASSLHYSHSPDDPAGDNPYELESTELLAAADPDQLMLSTDDADPAETDSRSETVTAQNGAPIHHASSQTLLTPSVRENDGRQAAFENAAWNVIFVAGLVAAMGLIAFGWLRTRQERRLAQEQRIFQQNLNPSPTSSNTNSTKVESAATSVETVDSVDERVGQVENSISEDCPVLSAGVDDDYRGKQQTAADVTEPDSRRSTVPADGEIQPDEWFGATWLADESMEKTASTETVAGAPAMDASTDSSPDDRKSFSDLEELIQNRMPIDLRQTNLPLRIALFGKPAGPRRLRIDAAHSQIAPPHMMTTAHNRKTKTSATSTADVSDSGRSVEQSNTVTASTPEYGRFDRALDYLEGQSDS